MPDIPSTRQTGNALTIGIVLAGNRCGPYSGWLCLSSPAAAFLGTT